MADQKWQDLPWMEKQDFDWGSFALINDQEFILVPGISNGGFGEEPWGIYKYSNRHKA